MTIYSERFLMVTGNAVSAQVTVAPGKRAVLRDLLVSATAAPAGATLFVGGRVAMAYNFPAPGGAIALDTRIAVYQGELVKLVTYGESCYAVLSGYLFADPTGQTGPPAAVEYAKEVDLQPLPAFPGEAAMSDGA